MKKKLYTTRIVKLLAFFLVLLCTLSFLQTYALRRLDHNSIRLNGFYHEEQDSLDVVLLGASEVYTSFAAGRAYDKFGFTSYPFATESITTDGMMTALKEIVRIQHPKLILIEPNAYLYGNTNNESNEGHIRKLIDNVPLNQNKIEFVEHNASPDEKIEYYLPLIKYHGMWSEYPKPMRRVVSTIQQDIRGFSYLKGIRTTTKIFKPDQKILNEMASKETGTKKLTPELQQKLVALLDYCKQENLNVVFFRTPHLVYSQTYTRVKRSNEAAKLINSYGYDYINLERDWKKIGLNLSRDFYNYDHMNIYGTEKLTDYLGKIVQNQYGVGKTDLSAQQKEKWDLAAKSYGQLYHYCDYLMQVTHEVVKLEEDINTLQAIQAY